VTYALGGEIRGDRMTFGGMGRMLAALLVAASVLGACSSDVSRTRSSFGTVSGTLVMEGGVAPGTSRTPIPGTVALSTHGYRIVTIHVPASGTFRAQVSAGRYDVTATTESIQHVNPNGMHVTEPCTEALPPITVEHSQTTIVNVVCIVP
jgi:hypothetical protein